MASINDLPGQTIGEKLTSLLQLQGAGLITKEEARRMLPWDFKCEKCGQ